VAERASKRRIGPTLTYRGDQASKKADEGEGPTVSLSTGPRNQEVTYVYVCGLKQQLSHRLRRKSDYRDFIIRRRARIKPYLAHRPGSRGGESGERRTDVNPEQSGDNRNDSIQDVLMKSTSILGTGTEVT
jgi:hypothetical protein